MINEVIDDSGIKEVAMAPKEYFTNASLTTFNEGATYISRYAPVRVGVSIQSFVVIVPIDLMLSFIDVSKSRIVNKSVITENDTSIGLSRIIGGADILLSVTT